MSENPVRSFGEAAKSAAGRRSEMIRLAERAVFATANSVLNYSCGRAKYPKTECEVPKLQYFTTIGPEFAEYYCVAATTHPSPTAHL